MQHEKSIFVIVSVGALWGFIEATLGGCFHLLHIPFCGTFLASIGFALLFLARKHGVTPSGLVVISMIAAACKFLDAPLFHLAPLDRMIVNPAIAIASQGFAMCLVFWRSPEEQRGYLPIGMRFLAAAACSIILFNGISSQLFGWSTEQQKHIFLTSLVQLPCIALLSTALSWATLHLIRNRRASHTVQPS